MIYGAKGGTRKDMAKLRLALQERDAGRDVEGAGRTSLTSSTTGSTEAEKRGEVRPNARASYRRAAKLFPSKDLGATRTSS